MLEPSAFTGVPNLEKEIQRSLKAPIGSSQLSALVDQRSKIALVLDDLSRPTPVAKLLPAVLAELKQGGVKLSQITLIPTLGFIVP